jgi:hypothetical protein
MKWWIDFLEVIHHFLLCSQGFARSRAGYPKRHVRIGFRHRLVTAQRGTPRSWNVGLSRP